MEKNAFLRMAREFLKEIEKASAIKEDAKEKAELFEQIGHLKMELEWLKKKVENFDLNKRRPLVEPKNTKLSQRTQCQLLGLHHSMSQEVLAKRILC